MKARVTAPRALIVLAGIAIASVVAFGAVRSRRHASNHVVVGVSRLRISLPIFVAARDGLFRARGLDVEIREYPTAQPMMDDVALGNIDAGGYVAYPIALLASRRATRPVVLATSLVEDATHRLSYVLARAGSGLRFPRDAAGRRIGILPTVAYRRWLLALLSRDGIDPASVTIVPVDPTLEGQTLHAGGVDLLFTNDPVATTLLARGLAEMADEGPPCAHSLGDPFAFGTFALAGTFAERSPELASRLVAALDEAIAVVRANPGPARHAMVPFLREEERPYVDRYPDSRYEDARTAGSAWLSAEIERERQLGILDREPLVRAWQPTVTR